MPSLSDIPLDLRTPEKKQSFIEWINITPIPIWSKRELIQFWCALNNESFNQNDYSKSGV